MYSSISVIIPTCGRPTKLANCLAALAAQRLPGGCRIETLVAVDGGDADGEYARLRLPDNVRLIFLPRVGMGAARNATIEQARGDLLVSTNDDTYPEPDWVAQHLSAHAAIGRPAVVVGSTRWREWPDPTVFDGLLRDTSMIFFYDRMKPGERHGPRHAFGCNTSLPAAEVRDAGGYEVRLRPYGYEDIEMAFRLIARGMDGVFYQPAAVNVHDHRLSWADYCRRETCLGRMAACLADINADCFEHVFGQRDAEAMRAEFEQWLAQDARDHAVAAEEMARWAERSLAAVGDWPSVCRALYALHLPVKRRLFRAGFVEGFALRDDARWLERMETGS